MSFRVRLTRQAQQDLQRLYAYVLERQLARPGGDLSLAQEALDAIVQGLALLERFPFTCRKAGSSPFLRELVIPFGATGYVALFEIEDDANVVVAAVRHEREDDWR